jgi:hypothetical protein
MQLGRKVFNPIALSLLLLCLAVGPVSAAQIKVEAEDYIDSYDITYDPITTLTVGVVDVLQGPDYSGEWVEYTLPVSAYGSYSFSMICWGDLNVSYIFNIYFIPDSGGPQQMITASFTGKGCFT